MRSIQMLWNSRKRPRCFLLLVLVSFCAQFQVHGFSAIPSFLGTAVSCPNTVVNNNYNLHMKISRGGSKTRGVQGSQISARNYERQKAAGRRGTKRFRDPNKVFVGNLDFQVTSEQLQQWLLVEQGIPSQHVVSVKVIEDWKTRKSKGYGFVQFTSPMYATSAMELIRNQKLAGRVVRLDQGQKKQPDPVLFVKPTAQDREVLDDEEALILDAIQASKDMESESELESASLEVVSFEELLDSEEGDYVFDDGVEETNEVVENAAANDNEDDNQNWDTLEPLEYEFYEEDELDLYDDSDEGVDGVYDDAEGLDDDDSEEESAVMNRAQRREAAKSKKKRRKPANGFGK